MSNFYVKQVAATGDKVKRATVEFTQGLNIIHGISDTGKTCIQMCIDYLFGGADLPFDKDVTGYSKVEMTVKTKDCEIIICRTLGTNIITAVSADDDSFNGKYNTVYKKESKNRMIDSLFLRLIGVEDEITLIKNKCFTRFRLTWSVFQQMFLIKEDDVHKKGSILLPSRTEANTLYFSALIYLLTGEDFSRYDAQEEKRIRDAKKSEIVAHIKSEIINMASKKEELEAKLTEHGDTELGNKVQEIITEVAAVRKRINDANERSKSVLHDIIAIREELVNIDLALDRQGSLRQHFIADIKRLTLIVDGEAVMSDVPTLEKCPYCEGEINEIEIESYTDAARSELARIVDQLNGLSHVHAEVLNRKKSLEQELRSLNIEKTEIDDFINEKLKPLESDLSAILKQYQIVTKIRGELDFVQRFTAEKNEQLREKEAPEGSKLEYLPKTHFDSNFRKTIDVYLDEIFKECNFEKFLSAHLDVDGKFDVLINGANKGTTRGQGYRAYINTLLALAFRKYMKDHGKYYPGVFFVDSPLQTLKQDVNDHAPDSMKSELFNYLIKSQSYGQIIVIENEIPKIAYEEHGIKPLYFTGGKSEGRYGFLHLEGQF